MKKLLCDLTIISTSSMDIYKYSNLMIDIIPKDALKTFKKDLLHLKGNVFFALDKKKIE